MTLTTNQQKVSKPNKSDLRARIMTSFIILAFLLPFIIFASTPQVNNKGYDYFFASVLMLVTTYAIFEISNAALPQRREGSRF